MNFWVATAQTGQMSTSPEPQAELLWITIKLGCQMMCLTPVPAPQYSLYNFLYNFTTELYFSDYFDIRLNFPKSYT